MFIAYYSIYRLIILLFVVGCHGEPHNQGLQKAEEGEEEQNEEGQRYRQGKGRIWQEGEFLVDNLDRIGLATSSSVS